MRLGRGRGRRGREGGKRFRWVEEGRVCMMRAVRRFNAV